MQLCWQHKLLKLNVGTEKAAGLSDSGNRDEGVRCKADKGMVDRVRNVEIRDKLKQESSL